MKKTYLLLILAAQAVLFSLATGCEPPKDNDSTIEIEDITLTPDRLDLKIGESATISVRISPESVTDYTVEWVSSDPLVATVENGTVTAIAEGTSSISASVGNVNRTVAVTVYKEDSVILPDKDPARGDFFYADGTWSSDLDTSKEVIGIVFYVGDPAKDDRFLREDHPQCTHGLVVAAYDYGPVTWQSNNFAYGKTVGSWTETHTDYESIISTGNRVGVIDKILGYNNTLAIEEFNAAAENREWPVEAVAALKEFREMHPSPSSTSGWYLPSIKEIILLCDSGATDYEAFIGKLYSQDNYELVNSKLSAAGAQILGADGLGFYYSSTELNFVEACCAISINNRMTAGGTKNNSQYYYTRYTLAF